MASQADLGSRLRRAGFTDVEPVGRGPAGPVLSAVYRRSHVVAKVCDLTRTGFGAHYWRRSFGREGRLLVALSDCPGLVRPIAVNLSLPGAGPAMACHVLAHAGTRVTPPKTGEMQVALRLLHDVLATVCHLHRRGVVHRDIKPSHMLINGSAVTLADLGAAASVTDRRPDQLAYRYYYPFGTSYAAPELFAGMGTSAVSYFAGDVWSLGACLYFLLVGRPPLPQLLDPTERHTMVRSFGRTMPPGVRAAAYLALTATLAARLERLLRRSSLGKVPATVVELLASFLAPDFRLRPDAESGLEMVRHAMTTVKGSSTHV